ncbi:MAG: helix-turn-helix domain-containing protein [Deltaproteobacteria bacterium]|jgi:DNA-binding XRE family transcriptional regulator|nr:helix-turn-helix domain-containing protein [Deltaproteobacteria bacterium]
MMKNSKLSFREIREKQMISVAELARKAGVSTQTINRVESGGSCRMDTLRKIILALGYSVEDKDLIVGVNR